MQVTPDLDARFRAAALAEGLVDVRYDVIESPVGELFVAATDRGLCRISYRPDGMEDAIARTFGTRMLRTPLDEVRRELDEYFAGARRDFDLALDLRVVPFHEASRSSCFTRTPMKAMRRSSSTGATGSCCACGMMYAYGALFLNCAIVLRAD